MPVKTIELDGSVREEDVTVIIGRNIILKLVEDKRAEELLSTSEVKSLLKTEDLCHTSFVEKMNSLLRLLDWSDLSELHLDTMSSAVIALFLVGVYMREFVALPKNKVAALPDTGKIERFTDDFFNAIRKRDQQIIELEEKLVDFNPDVTVVRPSVMFSCPRCGAPVVSSGEVREGIPDRPRKSTSEKGVAFQLGEFKGSRKCVYCKNSITRDEVKRHPIHEVIPTIEEVWRTGLWLEEYVASILRSLEWQTWTRVNILGTSGIRHEVNLLAIKKGFVLVGECKTGKVSREDVFTFSTKMTDLRCHLGLFGLLGELPEPETREFMKKNPAVTLIEKMCDLKRKDLIERFQNAIGKI